MSNQQSSTGRIMQTVQVDFCHCGGILRDGKCQKCGRSEDAVDFFDDTRPIHADKEE